MRFVNNSRKDRGSPDSRVIDVERIVAEKHWRRVLRFIFVHVEQVRTNETENPVVAAKRLEFEHGENASERKTLVTLP